MGKIVIIVTLLMTLAGAGMLVKKNQETRKGATALETSVNLLPSQGKYLNGEKVKVKVILNTGSENDRMDAAAISIKFDRNKLKFIAAESFGEYELIESGKNGAISMDTGEGDLKGTLVTLGKGKGGAVELMNLHFEAVEEGKTEMMIDGVIAVGTQEWNFNSKNGAIYQIGPIAEVSPVLKVEPPISPFLVEPEVTTKPGKGVCGSRCSGDNNCGKGYTCMPLWWPSTVCGKLPDKVYSLLQKNNVVSYGDVVSAIGANGNVYKNNSRCMNILNGFFKINNTKKDQQLKWTGVCRSILKPQDVNCGIKNGPKPVELN